jgi:hypothetical protein
MAKAYITQRESDNQGWTGPVDGMTGEQSCSALDTGNIAQSSEDQNNLPVGGSEATGLETSAGKRSGCVSEVTAPLPFMCKPDPAAIARAEARRRAVENGNLLGLLEVIRGEPLGIYPQRDLPDVSRCINNAAKQNVHGLTDDLFAVIMTMAGTMLTRFALFLDFRLKQFDKQADGQPIPIPLDLAKEGYLDRMARLSRFVTDLATQRARVRHLNGLEHEHKNNKTGSQDNGDAESLEEDPGPDD